MSKIKGPRSYTFQTEVVTGICPECLANTLLVGVRNSFYKCTTCGETLEQKINGVIKYIVADKDTKIAMRVDSDDGP